VDFDRNSIVGEACTWDNRSCKIITPLYYAVMKYLPILGLTVALVCYADLAVAKTSAEIKSISKAVMVGIRLLKDESVGSTIKSIEISIAACVNK
jgi:hypothetical protein